MCIAGKCQGISCKSSTHKPNSSCRIQSSMQASKISSRPYVYTDNAVKKANQVKEATASWATVEETLTWTRESSPPSIQPSVGFLPVYPRADACRSATCPAWPDPRRFAVRQPRQAISARPKDLTAAVVRVPASPSAPASPQSPPSSWSRPARPVGATCEYRRACLRRSQSGMSSGHSVV